jgi:hypothetical protein
VRLGLVWPELAWLSFVPSAFELAFLTFVGDVLDFAPEDLLTD